MWSGSQYLFSMLMPPGRHVLPTRSLSTIHYAGIHLCIILLPLAKCVCQTTAHDIRKTQTNSGTSDQSSCAKFAAESLLPPSSKNQVCRTPSRCQARAVGLEAVDVEVRAEEKDWREQHGKRLPGTGMLGDNESCKKCCREWVLCALCQLSEAVSRMWNFTYLPKLWRTAERPAWPLPRVSFPASAFCM